MSKIWPGGKTSPLGGSNLNFESEKSALQQFMLVMFWIFSNVLVFIGRKTRGVDLLLFIGNHALIDWTNSLCTCVCGAVAEPTSDSVAASWGCDGNLEDKAAVSPLGSRSLPVKGHRGRGSSRSCQGTNRLYEGLLCLHWEEDRVLEQPKPAAPVDSEHVVIWLQSRHYPIQTCENQSQR